MMMEKREATGEYELLFGKRVLFCYVISKGLQRNFCIMCFV